jgi:electron transfer flavoprotein beta subunit
LKILVPFKRVPDSGSPPGTGSADSPWVINPFDEIAIEEALRIRERGEAVEVTTVTVGTAAAEEQIRAALAMGVDRAIRVDDARSLDPYAVARILVGVVRKETPSLVLMGKQAVDDDANQVGQMLAGLLGWSQATFVSKIEVLNANQIRCTRETDRGLEVIVVATPAVITADLRLNEPRYVSLPGLMKARRRPIELFTCEEIGVSVEARTTVLTTIPASRRVAGMRVETVEQLVERLREHDKVL